MTQSIPQPALTLRRMPSWRAWSALWLPAILCVATLLSFNARLDTYLWCATRWAVGDGEYYHWANFQMAHANDLNRPFYMRDSPPMGSQFYRHTWRFWAACKAMGQWYFAGIAIALIALVHRRERLLAAGVAIGSVSSGFIGWLVRSVDGRYRPTHTDAANQWEIFRGFYNGTDLSFPSGHATQVFTTAGALSYVFPRGRPIFIALACLTGLTRVVQEAHFWSDVVLGSALGWTVGWLAMYYTDRFLALQRREKATTAPTPAPAEVQPRQP